MNVREAPAAPAVRRLIALLAVACAAWLPAAGASRPAERARHFMVAGPEPIAVEEGLKVLRDGGNAVDAAVTIGFVLAVTLPQAGNIGGGGYMLIRTASGDPIFIDYRETAPSAATRDMFLDAGGEVIPDASTATYKAAGVPGSVAGLSLALRRGGTISLARALAPAIRLARDGFTVGRGLERALSEGAGALKRYPSSTKIFFKGGVPLEQGDRLVQRDLADTLEAIARGGPEAFYHGSISRRLAEDMRAHGGLVTEQDLAGYRALERAPVRGSYRSYEIISSAPSSSGGIALIQTLHMLEPSDLKSLGHNSSAYVHLVSEATKRAFADRARWLGDADFVKVPVAGLLAPGYAASLMRTFDPWRATPAEAAGPGDPRPFESESTTHFSVVDAHGAAVANTYTLNEWFGCGAVADGLGFLLNNEMDDFSVKRGAPNAYDLVGGEANEIAPGKRMLSSMAPTIVLRKDGAASGTAPYLVLGSPGGPTIITTVLQVVLNIVEFGMDPQAAVDAPRFHHQWRPDRITLERGGFPADVTEALRKRGHEVAEGGPRGDVQAILVQGGGWLLGASDARGYGAARGDQAP